MAPGGMRAFRFCDLARTSRIGVALALVLLLLSVSSARAAIAGSAAPRSIVAENLETGRSITRYVREPRTTATSASVQATIASGPREVGVLLITFPGTASEPWSTAETRSEVFTGASSANAFYE